MDQTCSPNSSGLPSAGVSHAEAAPERVSVLKTLLAGVDEFGQIAPKYLEDPDHQNQLVQVRLGIATSMYHALRAKHAPTAAHSLRVALLCSSWAVRKQLAGDACDQIEVASLLHDVGKIGVPDALLEKSAKLTHDEAVTIEKYRLDGLQILQGCCASHEILEIVHYCSAWFDGSRAEYDCDGEEIPVGARMLAIADAFDSMTTDQVYRRAMSRDRAIAELFECAGSQFDPQLVREFCSSLGHDHLSFTSSLAQRWLVDLRSEASNALWSLRNLNVNGRATSIEGLFRQSLVNGMLDGVVFVDASRRILHWNRAAERLTGIPSTSVLQKHWSPDLVEMFDEGGQPVEESECPVAYVIGSKVQSLKRHSISARDGRRVSVDSQIVPVIGDDGVVYGAALVMHDASNQISLEERVESLHDEATKDPLTKINNRAVFDRELTRMVQLHLEQGIPCSLIICDLDFFKKINDKYGHQAGDEALVSFAALLNRHHRQGDVVARYGGEEFVMLCADCDNSAATRRAEEIRSELERLPQSMLDGRCITASFGVTELQPGDTPETMLNRADRGLLNAKELGRNRVVQLGSGISESETEERTGRWLNLFKSPTPNVFIERQLITPVPLKMVVEKLKGFVADHHAEITMIDESQILIKVECEQSELLRRSSDRPMLFGLRLQFEETRLAVEGAGGTTLRTIVKVNIRPARNRDRRRKDGSERGRQLLVSLKSYLMAHEHIMGKN